MSELTEQSLKTYKDYENAVKRGDPIFDRYDVFEAWKQERMLIFKMFKELFTELDIMTPPKDKQKGGDL